MDFDPRYFQRVAFTEAQWRRYLRNATRDLAIAKEDRFPEVKFTYSYTALIKAGIALIAKVGHVKVRSVPGHHVQILEKLAALLRNPDVTTMGNVMRSKRNLDFYGGGHPVTEKEAQDYRRFVERVLHAVQGQFRKC